MANNIDIIQLTKYDGTPFYPLVDINSVAGLSTRLNTIGYDIGALQGSLSSAQGSIAVLQGYFDANGKVKYANLPNLYIGNARVMSSAQTAQDIGGLGNLTPGATDESDLGSPSLEWDNGYIQIGHFTTDLFTPYVTSSSYEDNYIALDNTGISFYLETNQVAQFNEYGLFPASSDEYDFGYASLRWANIHAQQGHFSSVKIGGTNGATISWVAPSGNTPGYLYIDKPLVTAGDQIVGSGTPGSGGGTGTTPYLTDLLDVIEGITPTANKMLIWTSQGTNNAGTTGGWTLIDKSSVGVTTDATQSVHGLMSVADKTKLDGIAAGANNYTLPLAASGTRGGIQIGYTTSAANRNYAVQLSSEKAYVNVPWVEVTESTVSGWGFTKNLGTVTQVKVGNTAYNPTSGVISLPAYPSDYWKTGDSRTANTVLAAPNGSAGAASFRSLVAADIPTLPWSKITVTASDIVTKLGNTAVNRATADANGSDIRYNYVKNEDYLIPYGPGIHYVLSAQLNNAFYAMHKRTTVTSTGFLRFNAASLFDYDWNSLSTTVEAGHTGVITIGSVDSPKFTTYTYGKLFIKFYVEPSTSRNTPESISVRAYGKQGSTVGWYSYSGPTYLKSATGTDVTSMAVFTNPNIYNIQAWEITVVAQQDYNCDLSEICHVFNRTNGEVDQSVVTKYANAQTLYGEIAFDARTYHSNNSGIYYKDTSGNNRLVLTLDSNNNLLLGGGTYSAGYNTNIYGNNVYLRYSTTNKIGVSIESNGNISLSAGGTFIVGTATSNRNTTLNGTLSVLELATLTGGAEIPTGKKLKIGDAELEWIAGTNGNPGYLSLNTAFLSSGDQIVGSGTPGQGGSSGGAGYVHELQDTLSTWTGKPVVSALQLFVFDPSATDKNNNTGAWKYISKSDFLSEYATETYVGQQITALNLGTAATYNVGSVASGNTGLVTGGAVWSAIDNLPEPMVFKGSLGTGGTITTLPAASSANEGFTYKVITAGTYASKTAKVGDTFISTGSEWVLIPSGDEPEGTVTSVGLTVPTGLSVTGSPITSSGTLAITFASGYSIPTTANQTAWTNKYDKPSGGIPATDLASTVQTNITNGATAYGYFSSGVLPVSHGGTGKETLTSGSALIGNGTSAVTLRAITNNTSTSTALSASTNLITANTLYYYTGNSNITTVGTIGTGTWQGTPIANAYIANPWVKVGTTQINLGGQQTSLAGLVNVTMSGTLKVGDAEITWDGTNGYLKINKPLLTTGDQIVGSGTPSGGGGGTGTIPYLTDLLDVIEGLTPTANKMLIWTASGTNNGGTTGGWTLIDKASVGVTSNASQSAAGLMSAADKTKLDSIAFGTQGTNTIPITIGSTTKNVYTSLPTAAANTAGVIKVGSGLSISSGVLSATYSYTLPIASSSTLGGIKVGSGLSINATTGVLDATYTYTLPLAANGTRGGIQIGYTQSGKNYPVQLSSEKAYVNVPWTDVSFGTAGTDYVPITIGSTTKNVLTSHQSLSNYVTLSTAQAITGAKTFDAGAWILKGEESNQIQSRNWANGTYYKTDDSAVLFSNAAIRNAIRFRWYNDYFDIGIVRAGDSSANSFAISPVNSAGTHNIDLFRVSKTDVFIKGKSMGAFLGTIGASDKPIYLNAGTPTVVSTIDARLIKGYIAGGVYNLSFLVSHPEYSSGGVIIPYVYNDLAFLVAQGGSAKVYSTTDTDLTADTLTVKTLWSENPSSLFDSSPAYWSGGNDHATEMNEDGLIIDIVCNKTYSYTTRFYIDFGSGSWGFQYVDILLMNSDYDTVYTYKETNSETNGYAHYITSMSYYTYNEGGTRVAGFNKMRLYLHGRTNTGGVRIAQVGLIQYNSIGQRYTTMSRGYDDYVWRSITPNTTETYNLGASNRKWNAIYGKTLDLSSNAVIGGNVTVTGRVAVGTGRNNGSYVASDSVNNIYLNNSSGAVLVADGKVIRRGMSLADVTLGSSSVRWGGVYSTTADFSGDTVVGGTFTVGTASVNKATTLNGNLTVSGTITSGNIQANRAIYFKDTNNTYREVLAHANNTLYVGSGTTDAGGSLYLYGRAITLGYGASKTAGITINTSGAVTISGVTTLSSNLAVNGVSTFNGGVIIPSTATLKIGDATIEWVANSGNGYLKIDKPLLTTGDQIVGSGTPGSGGGSGSTSYLTDLLDVIEGLTPTANKMLIWTASGTNNGGTTGGWTLIDKASVGVTTVASASANGLMSSSDWSKLDGIEANANNYSHPTGGANTTISAANGKVLSAITVNNLGHVTSVSSKTLAEADIPNLSWSKITSGNDDLKLIEALTGAGFLKRASNNTWSLDNSTYLTSHQTVTLASGTNNGTLKITTAAGTTDNIAVKGLQALAYKASIGFSDLSAHPTTISGYGITDAYTKTEVDTAIGNAITSALYFRGESSTAITNGGTQTATINGSAWTAHTGDVVLYNGLEFAWDGSKWIQFGDESSYVLKTTTVNGHALSGNVTVTKSDVGLGNVENTALSTWAGTSNITTLGTITTGTWSGTEIAVNKGGTGKTSWTQYGVVYASGTTTLAQVANNTTSTKKFLRMTGTGSAAAAPAWDTVTKEDVGLGNVANSTYAGGTAVTLNGTSKASSTASFYAPTNAGTEGYILKANSSGIPVWSDDYAIKGHLYHYLTQNTNYSDPYDGTKLFRIITENFLADTLRFKAGTVTNIEYWDFTNSAWTTWETYMVSVLFDGNATTNCPVPYAQRKFRFEIVAASGWPSTPFFLLQGSWYNSGTYTPFEDGSKVKVILETKSAATDEYAVSDSFGFTDSIQCANARIAKNLHTGYTRYRITVEICPWANTDNAAQLRRICILSNYSGNPLVVTRHDGSGNFYPFANNTYSLGRTGERWSTVYGVNANFSGNTTVGGTLGVTGNTTLSGTLTVGTSSANKTTTHYGDIILRRASSNTDFNAIEIRDNGAWTGRVGTTDGIKVTDGSGTIGFFGIGYDGVGYFEVKSLYKSGYAGTGTMFKVNPTGVYSYGIISSTGNGTIGGTLSVTGATTLSSTLSVASLATLSGGASIPSGKTLVIGGATISWEANNGNGYLKIDQPLLTTGDQIVGSGTPGQGGGGGGSASFLSDLLDTSSSIDGKPSGTGYTIAYDASATDKNENTGAWIYVAPGTTANISGANGTARLWSGSVIKSAIEAYGYVTTDNKVTQTATTTSAAYEILFSSTADNTTRTESARKTSTLTYNPSTKALSTGGAVNGLTLSAQTTGFKISGGTTSKTLTVGADYTLGAACAKGVTDNSSATAVTSSDTNLITGRTLYYAGYVKSSGVTSITLTSGTGITVSDSGTAITGTGSRTISLDVAGAKTALGLGSLAYKSSLAASDIPDISATYVTVATAQTITAKHTFSNGFVLNTASSWTSSDRSIPFSADGDATNIRYYYTDSNKGLTFNPNTGELKAAKFTKRGGTSSQFLKADGSVDSSSYITGNQTITLSGDVSGSGTTSISVTIGSGKVTNAMLAGSIANGKLANSAITINGSSTSLGGSFSTASITAGTAGTSSATSGLSISVPYVTMNAYGIVTAYGTHTHSISKSDLTTALEGSSGYYVKKAGDVMTGTLTFENDTAPTDSTDGIRGGNIILSRGNSATANQSAGSISFYGRRLSNGWRNGARISAEPSPSNTSYDRQDLLFYRSNVTTEPASPAWELAMRISSQGQTFIHGLYTYSLLIDNSASGATSAGIRFRTEGTIVGGIFVNSSNDLYFSAGSSSSGNKVLTASNYDSYALPLAGGTMTGDIKMTNGEYINAENGYAMCGLNSAGTSFISGPGYTVSDSFYLRSGNINLTHRKHTAASTYTDYTIWDASNSNLITVPWTCSTLTLPNNSNIYAKDTSSNNVGILSISSSNNVVLGYGILGTGNTNIYGDTVSFRPTTSGTYNTVNVTTGATTTDNGPALKFFGPAANKAGGSIEFYSRSRDSLRNGFKIEAVYAGVVGDRLSLDFFSSNNGDPYTSVWKRALRITYAGNTIIGTSDSSSNLTVYGTITSTGDHVISSDATLKTNWRELGYGVKDIAKCTVGIFDWKDGHGTSIGTKAQDWEDLAPQLVHGEEGNKSLAYGQLALVNTILLARHENEQDKEIEKLKNRVSELEEKLKQYEC